jgi:1-pyrroline-4-hydroxy-2-carboxylate deaminase
LTCYSTKIIQTGQYRTNINQFTVISNYLKALILHYCLIKYYHMINWRGIFPAVTTKFYADGSMDLILFQKNIEAQLEAGVNGIVLGGTLGESSALSSEEKQFLLSHTLKIVDGRIPVVMNIAEGSTSEALLRVREAEQLGVNGFMLLPPMRYKSDHRETVQYFKTIAQSTNLPFMIYNNPIDYKIEVTLDMFDELQECRNIQAVKESTRDVTNLTRMINRFGDRFSIMCGVDTLCMEELLLGAKGVIAGLVCAFPRETVSLYNFCIEGKIAEAVELYRWFMPLLELDIHPKLVQYIKLAEQEVGLGSEHVRAPRLPLVGEERDRILGIIRDALEKRPAL